METREKLIYQYVTALDEGDLDAIDPVLEAAREDPELEQAIAEINLAYLEEEGIAPPRSDTRLVAPGLSRAGLNELGRAF